MARIDLNRVGTFVRVVEARSFTAAARSLGLPPSSISRSVARLEDELGVRLLHRTTRKLRLTDAGAHYFERMQAVMGEVDEATQLLIGGTGEARGVVRVTAPLDLGLHELPRLIAKLCARHPGLVVDLLASSRRIDLVEEQIDIAIRGGAALDDSTLVVRKLRDTDLGLFASRAYLTRKGRPRALSDLRDHACVLYRGDRGGKAVWRLLGPHGVEKVEVTGPINTDEMAVAHEAAVAGLGIGLLPVWGSEREKGARRLERVLPAYALKGAAFLVSPSRRLVPARVAVVRDFLLEELGKVLG